MGMVDVSSVTLSRVSLAQCPSLGPQASAREWLNGLTVTFQLRRAIDFY